MRILVIGNFGYVNNQLDGQTVKTRNVFRLLEENASNSLIFRFDTQSLRKNPFLFIKLFFSLSSCQKVVFLPGKNSLILLLPFVLLFSYFFKYELFYFVVGGWLLDFLNGNKLVRIMLYKFKRIFIESDDLRIKLMETYNFKNIDYFPNFRFTHDFDFIAMDDCKSDSEILKIVYVGRLIIDKGLDVIERFISYYVSNRDKFDKSVEIHFFGQFFDEKGKDYLTNVLCEHTCVFFHGELDPHLVCGVLKNFDLLVLPSRYPGEGSPGVINEAYMAGLPVIVSDWMYLSEFVIDGRTGFVFDLNKEIEFYNRIQELVNDTYLLDSMKENALAFSLSFNSRSAWDILYPYFGRPL